MPHQFIDPEVQRRSSSTQPFISASQVIGSSVITRESRPAGSIRDLPIDQESGRVLCAVTAYRRGFWNWSEHLYALPWKLLRFEPEQNVYRVDMDEATIQAAPSLTAADLERLGCEQDLWRTRLASYYVPYW